MCTCGESNVHLSICLSGIGRSWNTLPRCSRARSNLACTLGALCTDVKACVCSRCPKCNLAAVLDSRVQNFKCPNSSCRKVSRGRDLWTLSFSLFSAMCVCVYMCMCSLLALCLHAILCVCVWVCVYALTYYGMNWMCQHSAHFKFIPYTRHTRTCTHTHSYTHTFSYHLKTVNWRGSMWILPTLMLRLFLNAIFVSNHAWWCR